MKVTLLIISGYFVIATSAMVQVKPILEEKFIRLGGIEQWVTINGSDVTKPVVLFLHGGPGSVMSPYEGNVYGHWQNDLILVNWDQRGAGRTFGRNAPEDVNEDYWIENPLTVEQMTADGIELAEYLIRRLGKQKIILVGTSWGSVLGVNMAYRRPDLFSAYIGHAQIVDPSAGLTHAYHKVLRMARDANDTASIEKLGSLTPPPYDDARSAGQLLRIIKKYERANSVPAPESWWEVSAGYKNEKDTRNRSDGDDYSFIHYMGHTKLGIKGMISSIDLMRDVKEFRIPVYLIQGESDILTPPELTGAYYEKLKAPSKQLFLLAGAAHGHNQRVIDMQYKIITEYVLR